MRLEERMDGASLRDLGSFEPDEMLEDLDQIAESPKVSLRDLYYRWERTNWSVQELDFAPDLADWVALGPDVTERLLWVMSMFFHGEECVTATLAPWVNSAPTEEMQLFLSTQLADEARHTVFFDRFFSEVVSVPGDLNARLDWCRPRVTPGFEKLFFEMLPAISKEVGDNPRDPVVFARGIAMYHILLEGALAVPGQKYILAFCRDRNVLPAFRSGFTAVARDESRHVGAGVRILQDLIRMDGDSVAAVQELVREALPHASEQFQPPNADFTYLTVLGYHPAELFRFGLQSLGKRLKAAGVPFPPIKPTRLPAVAGEPVFPERELTPLQQMLRPMRDQIEPGMVFQGLPMVFNAQAAKGMTTTFQFDLVGKGGGSWTVRVADGACEVTEGAPSGEPDWRLEMDVSTWLDISTGELMGQEAFMLGRVTLEGNPIVGIRFDELFTPNVA
ncbi:MAG TPA: SCP2 sterol-binding domain-containing protein [Actinomycetota bacterium]|jgi:ribonucleoside-diphosphate reductase beta chain|nr:SCP2 sterol-binding domain-containing protein [Actinomycetota bacterium]